MVFLTQNLISASALWVFEFKMQKLNSNFFFFIQWHIINFVISLYDVIFKNRFYHFLQPYFVRKVEINFIFTKIRSFEIFLKKIEYMKAMLLLMKGDTLTAFNYFLKLPFGKEKLKLLYQEMCISKLLNQTLVYLKGRVIEVTI